MTTANMRAAPVGFAFDGQSLNDNPYAPGTGYSYALLDELGAIQGGHNGAAAHPWIGGVAWTQLVSSVQQRAFPWAGMAEETIYEAMGGTTDIALGVTGAQTWAYTLDCATRAKAAGFTYATCVTLSDGAAFDAADKVQRLAYNALIRSNPGGVFDAIIDLVPLEPAQVGLAWTRSGTTVTITRTAHGLVAGNTVTVSASSATTPLPNNGYVVVTTPTANTYTVTGVNSGAASGTATVTPSMNAGLDDTNSSSFIDGTHYTNTGRDAALAIAVPIYEALVA